MFHLTEGRLPLTEAELPQAENQLRDTEDQMPHPEARQRPTEDQLPHTEDQLRALFKLRMPASAGFIEKIAFLRAKRILQIKKKNLLNHTKYLFNGEIRLKRYKIKKPLEVRGFFF